MNWKTVVTFAFLLAGCNSRGNISSPQTSGSRLITRAVTCQPSTDPMACVRENCVNAGATFDEVQKLCTCPSGSILSTVGKYSCKPVDLTPDQSGAVTSLVTATNGRVDDWLLVNVRNSDLAKNFISSLGGSLSQIPLFNHSRQVFTLFKNANDMKILNLNPTSLHDINALNIEGMFLMPDLNLPVDANGGIGDAVEGLPFIQAITPPSNLPVVTGQSDLDQVIAASLKQAQVGTIGETFLVYSENGCADQCTGRTVLIDNQRFLAYRVRQFYQGALMQDQISIFDKIKRRTDITLFLFDRKVSNYILQQNGEISLHANEPGISNSQITEISTVPDPNTVPPFTLNADEVPVASFETAFINKGADFAILRGPYKDSHVYGWFKPEDNLPYFKNYHDLPTMFGEEDIEYLFTNAGHGLEVAQFATDLFKHSFIPFVGNDLFDGVFNKFLYNYIQSRPYKPLVASLSQTFGLSREACTNSPLGQAVRSHTNRVLWVVAATNSREPLSLDSYACPQNLVSPNLLKVASSSDDQTLAPSSAYGQYTVNIAEIGCPSLDGNCRPQDVGTSYAAPRLARKVADLMTEYPTVSATDVAFAIQATARVTCTRWLGELNPIPVISGGFADAYAAGKLLAERPQWPASRELTSSDWQQLLLQAKQSQYSGWYAPGAISNCVLEQAKLFMKRGG